MSYRYGLMNRPPMMGGLPPRLQFTWDRENDPTNPRIRHGVITCRELTAKEISDFELIDLNIVSGLKSYTVTLIHDGVELIFTCEAESEDHAVEQAENAYPDCMIDEVN